MKRFTLILVSLLTVFGMQSQIVSSRSEAFTIKKEKKQRVPIKLEFYAKAGVNIMNADWSVRKYRDFNPSEFSTTKSLAGLDIALGFMSHFRPSKPSDFYWGAEVGLTQVGGGFDEFTSISYNGTEWSYPTQNIKALGAFVTPVIGWNKGLSKNISLDIHFNPGCTFLFNNQYVEYYYGNNDYTDVFSVGAAVYPSFKIGAGVWIKKINIDFSYRHQTVFDDWENSYNNFILSLGYKF